MRLIFIPLLAFLSAFGLLRVFKNKHQFAGPISIESQKNIISCSPDLNLLAATVESMDIPPMPGAGNYKWNINSQHDSAQFYFNQGINTYFGFHIIESLASFVKAARFDSANALIWWARALAYGPNINDIGYTAAPQALAAIEKAKNLSITSTPFEKELIFAMSVRYSPDSAIARPTLNARYTAAMSKLHSDFPGNADAAALYADAMMLEHPWQLWKVDGQPFAWTPEIQKVLEKGLTMSPQHPGLNHYYIHVMEPSPFPEKALASADRMGKLNPGLAHLVHMPSHIYLRTGSFSKGYIVNEEALKQYKTYQQLFPDVVGNESLYRLHTEHMLVNCAMHAGRKKYSIDAANALQQSIDTAYVGFPGGIGNSMQYIYMIPSLMRVRFEDWNGLLAATPVASKYKYASLLDHFGRGMAYAGANDLSSADQESALVETLLKDSSLMEPFLPFSPAIDGAIIAASLLKGTLALKRNDGVKAVAFFKMAVEREQEMVYNEPRDWLLNPKNYLAAAYFVTGQYQDAIKTYQQDLNDNQENVWSLSGLHKCLLKLGKKTEGGKVLQRLRKASIHSDLDFFDK